MVTSQCIYILDLSDSLVCLPFYPIDIILIVYCSLSYSRVRAVLGTYPSTASSVLLYQNMAVGFIANKPH